jgi:hypothetical protein
MTSSIYSLLSGVIVPANSSVPSLNFGGSNTHPVKGTGVHSSYGVWTGYIAALSTVSFQWQQCTSSTDQNTCADINSATGQWYRPTANDTGKFLRVKATLTTRGQSVTAYSAISGASTNTLLGRRTSKRLTHHAAAHRTGKRPARASRTIA